MLASSSDLENFCENKKKVRLFNLKASHLIQNVLGDVKLERAPGKNEKLESFKLKSLKLESFSLSWKEPTEVGKNQAKSERTD